MSLPKHFVESALRWAPVGLVVIVVFGMGCWGGSQGGDNPQPLPDHHETRHSQSESSTTESSSDETETGLGPAEAEVEAPRLANAVYRRAHAVATGDERVDENVRIQKVETTRTRQPTSSNDPSEIRRSPTLMPERGSQQRYEALIEESEAVRGLSKEP